MAGHSVTVRVDGDTRDFEKALKNLGKKTQAGLADIKAGIDLTSAAAKSLFNVAAGGVKYTAGIEQLQTSFEVMTGSAEKAAEVIERLRRMGAETPFETADLASTTQLLMQYGFTADDALEKMRMLGDVAQGNKEALNSIALGYAQMMSAQKVNLQDIKQMINGGFNPLQEIAERTGESMGSLYERISKGTMSVDEITASLRAATSEGGKFFGSMDKQSQTLNGKLSTLKDNADQLIGSLTEGMSNELRDSLLPLANNMISELQAAFDARGMEGLLDAATGMLPDLLNMMTGRIEDSIDSLQKFAPKAVSNIMKGIPGAIRGTTSVLPQITAALFEVSGLVVTELVAMLPELVPVVVEGFAEMLASSLRGVGKLIGGFYDGIEQIIHKGQTKVLGMWIDDEKIAKYDFTLDVDVDADNAYRNIETAYGNIRAALSTDLLTDEQRGEITGMIGEDYQAIYDKLLSFGLSESDAQPIAQAVTDANEVLVAELNKLDVGVPGETILKWFAEAKGSKIALTAAMKSAGLDENEISQVTAVYDGMLGKVTDGTPSIMQAIYDKLTDGKPDDTQTVETLRGQIDSYVQGLLIGLDTAYQNELAQLDTTAADYQEKKAALDEWYASTKSSITGMNTNMQSLVTTLAGAPTSVVQARMDEFIEMEQYLFRIEEEINSLTGKAKSAAENAFQVVRSGAKTDEETINLAVSLKATEYKVDVQEAEDTYNAAMEKLNESFGKGEITKEEYEAEAATIEADKQAAINAAIETYQSALGEIFAGVAEAEGNLAAVESSGAKAQAIQMINNLMQEISNVGWENVDPTQKAAVAQTLTEILGQGFSVEDMEFFGAGPILSAAIGKLADGLDLSLFSGQLGGIYGKAIEDGILAGTAFDTTDETAQLAAIFSSVASGAVTSAAADLENAGETAISTAVDEMDDYAGAYAGGEDTIDGLLAALKAHKAALRIAGREAGNAFVSGYKSVMQIQSPSRVMMEAGKFTGEGLEIGLRESMEKAIATAESIVGRLSTGASFKSISFVGNMPNLQQEIALANEQNPVNLYINGRQMGKVMAADNASAQNAYNRTIALGVGK